MTGDPLDYALNYAAGGFPVLPLHTPVDGRCDCLRACGSPGKHPRTLNGLRDASTDADVIRGWWGMWPTANVGIAIPDGYVVVDVDIEGVNDVIPLDDLPTTATAKTGRGWHFLYRTATSVRPKAGVREHVDLRGPGSYIVAAPSRHVSGAEYTWMSTPREGVADAPDWVTGATAPGAAPAANGATHIPAGQRNATLASLGGVMRNRGMTEPSIIAALLADNAARCDPPLPEDEVRTIAHSVSRYAPEERGPVVVVGEPAVESERPHARPASELDPASALADVWLIEGVLRPGRVLVLASQEGVGKSYVRKELAMRLATQTGALFGHYPIPRPCRVLLVDVENGGEEEARREEEVLERLELHRADLGDYWRVSLEGLSLTDPADQAYIRGEVATVRPEVAIFDTGSSMVADEWGKELKSAVRFLRSLAREYGCAIVVAVHLVKPSRQAKPKDAPDHGAELADVMGQWTRQADSVALMAATSAPDRIRWTMRKRVPASTLILAPDSGIFVTVQAIEGDELGAMTRDRILRLIAAGETEVEQIAAAAGVTKRTVWRHVAALRKDHKLEADAPLRLSPGVTAPVRAQMTPRVAGNVTAAPGEGVTLSPPPPIGGGYVSLPGASLETSPDKPGAAAHRRYLDESAGAMWERLGKVRES